MAGKRYGGEWFTVGLEGFDAARKVIEQLPDNIQRNAMKQAVAAGARVILRDAKNRVPVKTGALKRSLEVVYVKMASAGKFGKIVYKVQASHSKGGFYAHFVELGTSSHLIKAKKKKALGPKGRFGKRVNHPGATAKPFLRPAFDAAKDSALAAIIDKLGRAILKQAQRFAGKK